MQDSSKDRVQRFLLDGILMQWRWIGEGIAMLVGVLGTWPVIAGIGEEREQ